MKKAIITLFLLTSFSTIKAQINLVRNPGFEDMVACPHFISLVNDARYWSGIVDTSYSLDTNYGLHGVYGSIIYLDQNCVPYYCSAYDNAILDPSREATVPNNQHFHHGTRSGNGLILLGLYSNYSDSSTGHFQGRMYLQNRLSHPLVAGKTYCVTCFIVLADASNAGCNHLGVYFDDGSIDTTVECGNPKTEYTPQVLSDSVVTDTTNWTAIQGSFTAMGGETFMTIGNFFDSANTLVTMLYGASALQEADYLIDDVSVIAMDDTAYAGPDIATTTTGDSVWVGDTTGYLPCYWYANNGTGWALIDSNAAGLRVHPDTTTQYVMQLNVCGHITTDTATVWVWTTGVQNIGKALPQLSIQPNPTKNKITVTGAPGCILHLYNVIGQQVVTLPAATNKQELDLTNLPPGTYTLQAINTTTGEKVSRRVVKE